MIWCPYSFMVKCVFVCVCELERKVTKIMGCWNHVILTIGQPPVYGGWSGKKCMVLSMMKTDILFWALTKSNCRGFWEQIWIHLSFHMPNSVDNLEYYAHAVLRWIVCENYMILSVPGRLNCSECWSVSKNHYWKAFSVMFHVLFTYEWQVIPSWFFKFTTGKTRAVFKLWAVVCVYIIGCHHIVILSLL